MELIYSFVNHVFKNYELDDSNLSLRNKLGQIIYDNLHDQQLDISRENIMTVYTQLGGDAFINSEFIIPNDLDRFYVSDKKNLILYNTVFLVLILISYLGIVIFMIFSIFNRAIGDTQSFYGLFDTNYGDLLFIFPAIRGILIFVTSALLLKFRKRLNSFNHVLIALSVSLLSSIYGIGMLIYSISKLFRIGKSINLKRIFILVIASVLTLSFTFAVNQERRSFIIYDLETDFDNTIYNEHFEYVPLSEYYSEVQMFGYIDNSVGYLQISTSDKYVKSIQVSDITLDLSDNTDILNGSIVTISMVVGGIEICESPIERLYTEDTIRYPEASCTKPFTFDDPELDTIDSLNENGIEIQLVIEYTNNNNEQVIMTFDYDTIDDIYEYQFQRK